MIICIDDYIVDDKVIVEKLKDNNEDNIKDNIKDNNEDNINENIKDNNEDVFSNVDENENIYLPNLLLKMFRKQ